MPDSPPTRASKLLVVAVMFLPAIGYSIGQWVLGHWPLAQRVDRWVAPYFFNFGLLVGLLIGGLQLLLAYRRTRRLSSFLVQQLVFLLVFTIVPLRLGHYVHGLSVFGLLGLGLALVFAIDTGLGGGLFSAYPEHFSPGYRERVQNSPTARRIRTELEGAFVVTMTAQSLFVLFGQQALPRATYLLVLPFMTKYLWVAFALLALRYGKWASRRRTSMAAPVAAVEPPLA